ncbi:Uncharacterised protein [Candidatus Burarchaeum australiense]|nr:Uncharacterised protein [Candidatus Burarchaeum australiense]
MCLPSRTAFTMVAKLSSMSTMSLASLATSVPVMPMDTPMSARFSAGASFTPSPVTAITSPLRFSAFTMRSLCSGETAAKTRALLTRTASSSSPRASSSSPVSTSPDRIPSSRATASAVIFWSPVIITTEMPASTHSAIACLASSRGWSIMAAKPTKTRSRSISSTETFSLPVSGL